MKAESLDLNRLRDMDSRKVDALRKAVSEGTYTVPAEDLAAKLMQSMFQNHVLDEALAEDSVSRLEAQDADSPQYDDAAEIPGGAMIKRKDAP